MQIRISSGIKFITRGVELFEHVLHLRKLLQKYHATVNFLNSTSSSERPQKVLSMEELVRECFDFPRIYCFLSFCSIRSEIA